MVTMPLTILGKFGILNVAKFAGEVQSRHGGGRGDGSESQGVWAGGATIDGNEMREWK